METKPKKVLIFVESDMGLGHFNVAENLAAQIRKQGGEAILVSSSFQHTGDVFSQSETRRCELPFIKFKKGLPVASDKETSPAEALELRKARIRNLCEQEQPDAVVFELFPFKMNDRIHDVHAIRDWEDSCNKRVPMLSLCRDIIHSKRPRKVLDTLHEHFDAVLVRGDDKITPLTRSMREWKDIELPVLYTGNIVSPIEKNGAEHGPVVVFGGGGFYPERDMAFFTNAINSRKHSGELANKEWRIFLPENIPVDALARIEEIAKSEAPDGSIHISSTIAQSDFHQLLVDSSAVINRGGYNTCLELASIGKPLVVISRDKSLSDQKLRAKIMEEQGYATSIPQWRADGRAIGNALQHELVRASERQTEINVDGAENAAQHILEYARAQYTPEPRIDTSTVRAANQYTNWLGAFR